MSVLRDDLPTEILADRLGLPFHRRVPRGPGLPDTVEHRRRVRT